MVDQAYTFNRDADYRTGGVHLAKDLELQNVNIQVIATQSAKTVSFGVAFLDILSAETYKLPKVKSDAVVSKWFSNPLGF